MKQYYVYIIGNYNDTTLYIWVTSNLVRRIYEHKNKLLDWFSKDYSLNKLLHYEIYNDINIAIEREKKLKNWHRNRKIDLIKKSNPDYIDLYDGIL